MNKSENQLDTARYTVIWFATHASIPLSQIKKYISYLCVNYFFNKCCETIEEYQRRRIAVACIRCIAKHQILRTWRIERMAGLNEKRTRPLASQLLGFAVKFEPS